MTNMNKLYPSSGLAIEETATRIDEAPSDQSSEASHETTEAPASLAAPPTQQHLPASEDNKEEKTDGDYDGVDDGGVAASGSLAPPSPPLPPPLPSPPSFKDQVGLSPNDPLLQREPRIDETPLADPAEASAFLPGFKDQARTCPNDPRQQLEEPWTGEPPAGDPLAPVFAPWGPQLPGGLEQQLEEQTTLPSAEGVPISVAEDDPPPSVHAVLLPYDEPKSDGATGQMIVRKRWVWAASFALLIVVISVVVAVVLSLSSDGERPGAVETKLTASDGTADDWFGCSVAISGDTIVVGARYDTVTGTHSGSAYIYTRLENTSVWTQQTKLTARDGAEEDKFGYSVAVDGDTVVVGSTWDTHVHGLYSGSAYIFTHSGTIWTEQAKLIASDGGAEEEFGVSVAISEDTVVVGARYGTTVNNEGNVTWMGKAYIYVRSGTLWTEQAILIASDLLSDVAEFDEFGKSVAIDGDTVAVGAVWDGIPGYHSGSTYIYSLSGNLTWTQQAKLIASDTANFDEFGRSVAISGDTVLVGAPGESGKARFGKAYIYIFSNTTWTEQARLVASDGASDDHFGWSVAIEGETAVIGAIGDDDIGSWSGSAYIYTHLGTTWTEQEKLTAADGAAEDEFGRSVAISGATVIIGAPFDDDNGSSSGSFYVADL